MTTIAEATAILGECYVVNQDFINFKYGIDLSVVQDVGYPAELLKRCRHENEKDRAYWMLIFMLGRSVREQHLAQDSMDIGAKVFYKKTPFGKPDDYALFRKKSKPDYYLIRFQPYFSEMNWEEMRAELAKQEPGDFLLDLCPIHIFTEAVLHAYMKTFIRFPENWYHATEMIDEDDLVAVAGNFNKNGMDVNAVRTTGKGGILKGVVYYQPAH